MGQREFFTPEEEALADRIISAVCGLRTRGPGAPVLRAPLVPPPEPPCLADVLVEGPAMAKALLRKPDWFFETSACWAFRFETVGDKPERQAYARAVQETQRKTIDALVAAGLKVPGSVIDLMVYQCLYCKSCVETIEWLVDRGWLTPKSAQESLARHGGSAELARLAGARSPEADKLFEKLYGKGFFGGEAGIASTSDFAALGFFDRARFLWEAGNRLERTRKGGPRMAPSMPLEAYCLCVGNEYHPNRDRTVADPDPEELRAGVELLRGWGARPDEGPGTSTAFALLLGRGSMSYAGAPLPVLAALGPELKASGCDPNDGPWMADALAQSFAERCIRKNRALFEEEFDWAKGLGFDPALHFKTFFEHAGRFSKLPLADEYLEFLAGLGLDAKKLESSGDLPLGVLFRRGEYAHARRLMAMGANAAFSGEGGDGALHSVVERRGKEDLDILRELLARPEVGSIVDRPCRKGQTALMRACFELNEQAIQELAAAGADVNARDEKGWTPLRHLLRKFGVKAIKKTEPILRLLVSLGADPSIADNEGLTPAQAASAKAPLGALAELFAARPADLAGESDVSQAVRTQLEARGAAGQSLSEKVQLSALCEGDDGGQARVPKRGKSKSI